MTYDEMLSLYGTFGWFLSIKTRGDLKDGMWASYDDGFIDLKRRKGLLTSGWRGQHIGSPEEPPETGDGFALYYNSQNPAAFKNRVVLVGKLGRVHWDPSKPPTGRHHEITLEYDLDVLKALRYKPLHKTKANAELFENSCIKSGVIGTFYRIAPRDWEVLLREVAKRM